MPYSTSSLYDSLEVGTYRRAFCYSRTCLVDYMFRRSNSFRQVLQKELEFQFAVLRFLPRTLQSIDQMPETTFDEW